MIEGPKKVGEIIERFNFMENIKVISIKHLNTLIYDVNDEKKKENMDIVI